MKKFLASVLMFLVLLASAVQGQAPVEQRWFNLLPSDYVYSAFSTGDKLGYVTTDFVGVLPTGATVQLSSDMVSFYFTASTFFVQDVSGNVKYFADSQWTNVGIYNGMASYEDNLWLWKGNTVSLITQDPRNIRVFASVPNEVTYVSGLPANALVSTNFGAFKCTESSCERVDLRSCDKAWELKNGDVACLKGNVLSLGQQFFDNVSGASFSHGLLYFLQGDKLYALESSATQISKVAANSVLSGDFLITPAGTFQLKGQTLQKVSSKVRLPLLGSISPGPTFISDNYRLVFTDKGWTEEIQDENGLKVNGLLMWEAGGQSYSWGETSRTIRGTIIDGFGDDQEGYLLVVNGDRMGRKNLLVVDAVTGKPLASMGVKPILSYGYTGEGYYVSTSSEIKLLSLGTITSLEAKVPPQDVVQWNGSVYYSYGEYLVGPLVYKFPDAITELVPSENGVLVVTASSLYLVSSDVKDLGQVFPNYPAGKVLDVATEGDRVFLLTGDGIYTLLPQVHVVLHVGKNTYTINGVEKTMDVSATIINSRTMVPIRVISEAFGYSVQWDDSQKKVTITGLGHSIELFNGKPTAYVDGAPMEIDAPPTIVQGTMLVPVRFIVESMGLNVLWDPNLRKVEVTLP